MRFRDSIFGRLLESINRRQFQTVVDRLNGDACDKSFKSWDHLVALIYAQLSSTDSLRASRSMSFRHETQLGGEPDPRR
jgi:putative transposase